MSKAIEKCVADLMSQGKSRKQAEAICAAGVAGVERMAIVRASLPLKEVDVADYAGISIIAENAKDGRLLAFKDAVLAHATINKNQDGLTSAGLQEVAATLPLTPIDIGHDSKQVMGVFTAARVRDWQRKDGSVVPDGELVTDGVMFARNYPEETQEIMDGVRHLSIEAGADKAVFHVDAQTGDVTRYLFGLTALGAGTTKEPADAEAVFDTENGLLLIASIRETVQIASESIEETLRSIHNEFYAAFPPDGKTYRHCQMTYADHLIVTEETADETTYWHVPYAVSADGGLEFVERGKWTQVERVVDYLPVQASDQSDMQRMVRQAFRRSYRDAHRVVDIAADYLVYERGGKLYRADFKVGSDGNVSFGTKHTEVTKKYAPVDTRRGMMADGSRLMADGSRLMADGSRLMADGSRLAVDYVGGIDVNELEKLQKELDDLKAEQGKSATAIQERDAQVAALTAEVQTLKEAASQQEEAHKTNLLTATKRAVQLSAIFDEKKVEDLLPKLAGMDEDTFGLIIEASKKGTPRTAQVAVVDDKPVQDDGLRGLFATE